MKKLSALTTLAVLGFPLAAQAKVFPDPAGDVKIRSLDIRKVDASVTAGTVTIKIILATRTSGQRLLRCLRLLRQEALADRGQTRRG